MYALDKNTSKISSSSDFCKLRSPKRWLDGDVFVCWNFLLL